MQSCHQKTVSSLVSSDSSDSDSSLQCTADAGTQNQDFEGLILKEHAPDEQQIGNSGKQSGRVNKQEQDQKKRF